MINWFAVIQDIAKLYFFLLFFVEKTIFPNEFLLLFTIVRFEIVNTAFFVSKMFFVYAGRLDDGQENIFLAIVFFFFKIEFFYVAVFIVRKTVASKMVSVLTGLVTMVLCSFV